MKLWKYIVALILAVSVWIPVHAEEAVADSVATEADFNVKDVIFGHTSDSYEWHIANIGEKSVVLPLPVIIRSKTSGWHVFSSAKVEEGHKYEGFYISEESGKIVERNAAGEEIRPLDLSITKNVLSIFISSSLLVWLVLGTARWYRKHDAVNEAPRGIAAFMEPVIMMIDTGVAKDSIGEDYAKFSPYLCTVFLWILLNNLLGLVPFFPGGANVTGNIAVTCVLACFTFFMINLFGTKHYFQGYLLAGRASDAEVPYSDSSDYRGVQYDNETIDIDDKALCQYACGAYHRDKSGLYNIHLCQIQCCPVRQYDSRFPAFRSVYGRA